MKKHIVGRENEAKVLDRILNSNKPEFLAIYGRRRVGKTYLIKNYFNDKACIFFSVTGLKKATMHEQIKHFTTTLSEVFYNGIDLKPKTNWDDTFELLNRTIKEVQVNVVIFFDEFPWMVTPRSKLLESLDYYWNQYWSMDHRIKLIVCGSSASWIIDNIINNKGGLHNRLTYEICLDPFNLSQTKQFLESRNIKLNNKHITEIFMTLGGIPYYLNKVEKGLSATQVIESLGFTRRSFLLGEFDNLFSSLFKNSEVYIEIITTIASYRYGIGQSELLKKLGKALKGKGGLQKLKELEQAGFIISFKPLYHKEKGIYYRVIDNYSLFYLAWLNPIKNSLIKNSLLQGYWDKLKKTSSWLSWAGLTFESICYEHLSQISKALNLSPTAIPSTWKYTPKKDSNETGAQIDLLFDRDDDAITICEIKYTEKPFVITKEYAKKLENKLDIFRKVTRTKKQLFIAIISSSEIKQNKYSDELICGVVTLDYLFNGEE